MNLGALVLETRNPQAMDLGVLSTLESAHHFNQQDILAAEAVRATPPEVARVVNVAADALRADRRTIYMGVGTSGRPEMLDVFECPPAFDVPHGLVVGLIAGGSSALLETAEGTEDNPQLGENGLRTLNFTTQDLVVGLVTPGRTLYVIGELKYTRSVGCMTTAISCSPDSPVAREADVAISPVVEPEALTGLTRLKPGTV